MGGDVQSGKQGDHELHEKDRILRIVRVISLGTLRVCGEEGRRAESAPYTGF